MRVVFKGESQLSHPTFADVKPNQFFVSTYGKLFQKCDGTSSDPAKAVCIASPDGSPECWHALFEQYERVSRILPDVTKVEF
jgi:hypothetical protein